MQKLDDQVSVAGQIQPAQMAEFAAMGFKAVLCHRPDAENPEELQHGVLAAAAAENGLAFYYLPIVPGVFPPEVAAQVKQILATTQGQVFAYCASGRRAATIWEMAQ